MTAKNSPAPRVAVEMGLLMASQGGTASTHAGSEPSADAAQIQALTDRVTRLEQALSRIRMPSGNVKKETEEIPLPDDEFSSSGALPDEPYDDAGFFKAPPEGCLLFHPYRKRNLLQKWNSPYQILRRYRPLLPVHPIIPQRKRLHPIRYRYRKIMMQSGNRSARYWKRRRRCRSYPVYDWARSYILEKQKSSWY